MGWQATCVPCASATCMYRGSCGGTHSVQRSEVATNTSDLVLKNLMEEPRLELSLSGGCGGDITGLLSSPEDDKVLSRGEGGRVERGIGLVGLESSKGVGFDQLFESESAHILATVTCISGLP